MVDSTSITSGTLIAAGKVKGTNVYNLAGEKLGSIDKSEACAYPLLPHRTRWHG